MKPRDIRLIAMDMDGTLLNSKQQVSEGNALALQKASEAGVKLAICSGRMAADIAMFALENDLKDCALLGSNGTHCWLNPDGEVFADHAFETAALHAMLEVLWKEELIFGLFAQNKVLVYHDDECISDRWWASHDEGTFGLTIQHAKEHAEVEGWHVNKLVLCCRDPERIVQIRRRLEAIDGLDVTSSWIENLEIMPAGFNKGTAVAELAAYLGLDASQVMTFGDYDNDLPMIEWAGWGTAMGNANEKVKLAAKLVTLTNNEDGVGKAIEKYVLS